MDLGIVKNLLSRSENIEKNMKLADITFLLFWAKNSQNLIMLTLSAGIELYSVNFEPRNH